MFYGGLWKAAVEAVHMCYSSQGLDLQNIFFPKRMCLLSGEDLADLATAVTTDLAIAGEREK